MKAGYWRKTGESKNNFLEFDLSNGENFEIGKTERKRLGRCRGAAGNQESGCRPTTPVPPTPRPLPSGEADLQLRAEDDTALRDTSHSVIC